MPTNVDNRYGSLSAWAYDLDKPIGHSFGDVEFLLGRLKDCPGPISGALRGHRPCADPAAGSRP